MYFVNSLTHSPPPPPTPREIIGGNVVISGFCCCYCCLKSCLYSRFTTQLVRVLTLVWRSSQPLITCVIFQPNQGEVNFTLTDEKVSIRVHSHWQAILDNFSRLQQFTLIPCVKLLSFFCPSVLLSQMHSTAWIIPQWTSGLALSW